MALSMEALEEMYRRYGLIVERRCARILGSPSDARDAAHEAFARAAQKLQSFRGENDRLAWLYRISTNVCLNVLRERRLRGESWLKNAQAALDRPVADGERAAAERQWATRLLAAADDDLTRALVLHVYIDEMSQGEAAELLGISRATANARLGRFRQSARSLLEESR
jgi:RNA polymerase sigma-70 factor (ECF subfamily)